jgi:hypothetical protein
MECGVACAFVFLHVFFCFVRFLLFGFQQHGRIICKTVQIIRGYLRECMGKICRGIYFLLLLLGFFLLLKIGWFLCVLSWISAYKVHSHGCLFLVVVVVVTCVHV